MKLKTILVANNHLSNVGGSETFTYSLIEELVHRKEFDVEYFTFQKGVVSERIEKELGVKFRSKKTYDLILASHNTCVDELFKSGFVIQTCHGIFPILEQPSLKANGYVSISQEVQNHLSSLGFSSKIVLNGINLDRFKSKTSISKELQTVLSLCQSDEANRFIKKCCEHLNLKFLKANKFEDNIWEIEKLINNSDLVVGLGRSAYDAMSCGRPVIVYDNREYLGAIGDGYVKNILGLSIQNNCSGRYFNNQFSEELFIRELKKYNYKDGDFFREFALKELNISTNTDKYLFYWKNLLISKREKKHYKMQKYFGKNLFNFLQNFYGKILNIVRNK
ncbi:MAG: glycosyltransferase involved in cell wall biosynthesis [Flavobacteriaceae bacterium]|jgi:glycosyltransferase involved in cell wall biosynthesis